MEWLVELRTRQDLSVAESTSAARCPTTPHKRNDPDPSGRRRSVRALPVQSRRPAFEKPNGLLRLAVSSVADGVLSGDMLSAFGEAYPDVRLDVLVTDEEFDIVSRGFDAGVRLGEVIEQDMIAVPITGPQRQRVVAAPSYLSRAGVPNPPQDLAGHRCMGWRPAPDMPPYHWEFGPEQFEFSVAVDPAVTSNDMALMIRLACGGGGLTIGMAQTFFPWLEHGELVPVLEKYLFDFPGFFLFYPNRNNLEPRLRAFIDHVKKWRRR